MCSVLCNCLYASAIYIHMETIFKLHYNFNEGPMFMFWFQVSFCFCNLLYLVEVALHTVCALWLAVNDFL
jgi:hypothetical protein